MAVTDRFITEGEYHVLIKQFPLLNDDQKKLIFRAMVKEERQSDIAKDLDLQRQTINRLVRRVWTKYQEAQEVLGAHVNSDNLPQDWSVATFAAPDFMIKKFQKELKLYIAAHNIKLDDSDEEE